MTGGCAGEETLLSLADGEIVDRDPMISPECTPALYGGQLGTHLPRGMCEIARAGPTDRALVSLSRTRLDVAFDGTGAARQQRFRDRGPLKKSQLIPTSGKARLFLWHTSLSLKLFYCMGSDPSRPVIAIQH